VTWTILSPPALILFPALMTLSGCMDLLTYKIPNRVCAMVVLGFFVVAACLRVPMAVVLLNVSCAVAVLAITFAMFSFKWIGGGDAKLAAATALWLGWSSILDYGLVAALCGGILTLALLSARMIQPPAALNRYAWIARLTDKKAGVPYGIALAAAGLMEYPNSRIWSALLA
jgi:prepilin peptidase CpaA